MGENRELLYEGIVQNQIKKFYYKRTPLHINTPHIPHFSQSVNGKVGISGESGELLYEGVYVCTV